MRLSLVTTTINKPVALEAFRRTLPSVRCYVAGDLKTPREARDFCVDIGADYLSPDEQRSRGYKCSELISFNTISRRNIALLEALKDGAEAIYFWDDDNLLISSDHFASLFRVFGRPFDGIQASSESGWFDVGTLLDPVAPHRGFPHVKASTPTYSHCTQRRVGVAAGICLGDPDISATTRIARAPVVHRVSELLRAGIVVDPAGPRAVDRIEVDNTFSYEGAKFPVVRMTNRGTWTVFNSQNTAIIRELAPAFFMVPQWGRYDDIWASLLVQRLMRERGFVVHFGQPFVWQQRNVHDLLRDLRAEQFGAEYTISFSNWLDGFVFTGKERVTDQMRIMFHNLPDWMPERNKIEEMVFAWASDCDEVMK